MPRTERATACLLGAAFVLACGQPPVAGVTAQSLAGAPVVVAPSASTRAPGTPAITPPPAPSPTPSPAPALASKAGAAAAPGAKASQSNNATSLTQDPLATQILNGGSAALKAVLATPEKYRFQVLYGVITPGAAPKLERHGYRADVEYFFPASSMKVPITLATYDRLATLRSAGKPALTRDATMRIHPVSGNAEPYVTTLARETWRALIVSDNASANRLLAVVGHREAHETLWPLGLPSVRIHDGFATGGEIDPAELSPRIEFVGADGGVTAELPARRSDLVLPATEATGLAIGKANIVDGRRVDGPLSFADKNAIRLRELQDTLVRIMRPDLLPAGSRPDTASKEDLAYVREALGTLPSTSGLAGFDRNVVADYQLSPFLRGIERVRARGQFLIHSKVGQAFGFLIANAYIVDKATGRAFFLIASVYANPDETMNDDTYAYDAISFPALADVGEAFCRHAFGP
ncbi:MAG: hypothetical protein QOI41_4176 [Myxococcales bacterium]|nr:hypothetical protein [Myxococcales bacterium]